jgi:hypothetical protein
MPSNRITGVYDPAPIPLPPPVAPVPAIDLQQHPEAEEILGRQIINLQVCKSGHVMHLRFFRRDAREMCRYIGRYAANPEMPWYTWTDARDCMDVIRDVCAASDRKKAREYGWLT